MLGAHSVWSFRLPVFVYLTSLFHKIQHFISRYVATFDNLSPRRVLTASRAPSWSRCRRGSSGSRRIPGYPGRRSSRRGSPGKRGKRDAIESNPCHLSLSAATLVRLAVCLSVRSNSAEAPPAKSRRACARNSSGNPVPSASDSGFWVRLVRDERGEVCELLWTCVYLWLWAITFNIVFQIIIRYTFSLWLFQCILM